MKIVLVPTATTIRETLQGHQVRIISKDAATKKVKVKSLSTGLTFVVREWELRLPS